MTEFQNVGLITTQSYRHGDDVTYQFNSNLLDLNNKIRNISNPNSDHEMKLSS